MTEDWIRKKYENIYNVIDIVDAGELCSGIAKEYQFFFKNYKREFDSLDRLIIYSSYFLGEEFIESLYKAARIIDISPCFILICGNKKNKESIKRLSNTVDEWKSFEFIEDNELSNTKSIVRSEKNDNSLCPLPWSHLEVTNHGGIRPCCVNSKIIGDVNKDNINDVFYGNDMSHLREQMINGHRPDSCNECWKIEDNGLTSNRMRHMSLTNKKFFGDYLHSPRISSLDIKPGNLCNFKCRICDSTASSSHLNEQNNIRVIPLKSSNWESESSLLTNDIFNMHKNLDNLDFYGGEPFLVKTLSKLVHKLSKTPSAKNIRLHYNTNGSVFPEFLFRSWENFKEINIMFSIDDIGKRFEIQRGGSWSKIDDNITKFSNLNMENLDLGIMPTINIMNCFYLDDLMKWAEEKQIDVFFNYLTIPIGYLLTQLTKTAKKSLAEKYNNTKYEEIANLMHYINELPDSDGKEFLNITEYYDNIRNENFYKSHQEIFDLMNPTSITTN